MASLRESAPSASAAIKIHDPNAAGRVSLDELLELYLAAHPDLGQGTIGQYKNAMALAKRWLEEKHLDADCESLFNLTRFREWTAWLLSEPEKRATKGHRENRTVKGRRDTLLTFWRFASDEGHCTEAAPPYRKLAKLKVPQKDPVAWSVAEMKKIVAAAKGAPPISHWTPGHWDTFLQVMFFTAERFTALLQCLTSDLSGDVLTVRASTTKDKKEGITPLPPELATKVRSLPAFASGAEELIWPYPYQPKTMREHYKRHILKPAGMPFDRSHLLHCIRRASLTELVNVKDPAAAQTQARHTTPQMTLKYISQKKLRKKSASLLLPSLEKTAEQLDLFH